MLLLDTRAALLYLHSAVATTRRTNWWLWFPLTHDISLELMPVAVRISHSPLGGKHSGSLSHGTPNYLSGSHCFPHASLTIAFICLEALKAACSAKRIFVVFFFLFFSI